MNLIVNALRRNTAYLSSRPFYRKYPKHSRTRLSWIDARGAADFEVGSFFSRVPKSANSFVLLELFKLRSSEELIQQVVKKQYVKPSEMTQEQVADFERLFKFTFVRNPYTRTLSAYLDKIIRLEKPIKQISRKRLPTFSEFCDYLDTGGGLHENIHWAPQTSIILLPAEKFDYIGRIENMDRDLPFVLGKLKDLTGRTTPADFAPGGSRSGAYRAPKADDKVDSHYDAKTTEIVTRLYAEDFRQLGYPTR